MVQIWKLVKSEERPNLGAELAHVARVAQVSFGNQTGTQLTGTLHIVTQKANEMGGGRRSPSPAGCTRRFH